LKRAGYDRQQHEVLTRDADAWFIIWHDYKGDLQQAFKGRLSLANQGGKYSSLPQLDTAVTPFNHVFGMAFKRGRKQTPDELRGPRMRVAPTQDAPWFRRGKV
jgi:hypothetical protein